MPTSHFVQESATTFTAALSAMVGGTYTEHRYSVDWLTISDAQGRVSIHQESEMIRLYRVTLHKAWTQCKTGTLDLDALTA